MKPDYHTIEDNVNDIIDQNDNETIFSNEDFINWYMSHWGYKGTKRVI